MHQNQLVVDLTNSLKNNAYDTALALVKDIRPID